VLTRSASLLAGRVSNSNTRLSGGPLLIRGTSGGTTEPDGTRLSVVILVQRTRILTGKTRQQRALPANTRRPYEQAGFQWPTGAAVSLTILQTCQAQAPGARKTSPPPGRCIGSNTARIAPNPADMGGSGRPVHRLRTRPYSICEFSRNWRLAGDYIGWRYLLGGGRCALVMAGVTGQRVVVQRLGPGWLPGAGAGPRSLGRFWRGRADRAGRARDYGSGI